MTPRALRLSFVFVVVLIATPCLAGGPLMVGGPKFGVEGKPFVWNPASMPIHYQVDGGAFASTGTTIKVSNSTGLSRVQSMLGVWQGVSTAAVSFSYSGGIAATSGFTDGDVSTISEFNAVRGDCRAGTQNPIIFDADGSLASALGLDNLVLGFAGPCKFDSATGYITAASATLIGKWQDGVNNSTNYEVSSAVFDEVLVHEFGHFLGLDHSQINLSAFYSWNCSAQEVAGLPLMFPISFCDARSSYGLPPLSPDDTAWISKLYPAPSFATTYGVISGYILFPDGISQAQGVNVIARRVDNPATPEDESRRIAFSVVSGFLFTDFPGQSITEKYLPCSPADRCPPNGFLGGSATGSSSGSRDPKFIGYYEIPVTAGSYTIEIESIDPSFEGGSSVGPLSPPVPLGEPAEFWDDNESPIDLPDTKTPVSVSPGQTIKNINVILNGRFTRFDQFEDSGTLLWLRVRGPKSVERV